MGNCYCCKSKINTTNVYNICNNEYTICDNCNKLLKTAIDKYKEMYSNDKIGG